MAVFATEHKETFLDMDRTEGNIFDLIDEAVTYIIKNIRWRVEMSGDGIHRKEIPEIPVDAIREAVINSFAHARYDLSIQHEIDILSNRISICNPGSFANEFEPIDFYTRDIRSFLRNEVIAKTLYLTTSQLCSILKNEYGMETHRTTIKSDIEMLQQAGISIQAVRSSQNQYNYIERDFDIAELKLLIDAVMSAKFMTKGKSDQLVAKLTALAGANKARELKRNLTVDGRYKMENEQILMTIDAINDAINQRRKIKFQKIEYNVKKEQVLHHGGETYTFSPYSLVWDGDFYYVVGFSDKY